MDKDREMVNALSQIYHLIHFYREGIYPIEEVMKIEDIAAPFIDIYDAIGDGYKGLTWDPHSGVFYIKEV